jgi:hypothetical protein
MQLVCFSQIGYLPVLFLILCKIFNHYFVQSIQKNSFQVKCTFRNCRLSFQNLNCFFHTNDHLSVKFSISHLHLLFSNHLCGSASMTLSLNAKLNWLIFSYWNLRKQNLNLKQMDQIDQIEVRLKFSSRSLFYYLLSSRLQNNDCDFNSNICGFKLLIV